MDGNSLNELNAIDRLHGLEWFWARTLWEIEYQPVAWTCFMLIVLGLFFGAALLIVALTRPRKVAEANDPTP